MLSKKVCKLCWKNILKGNYKKYIDSHWTKVDEDRWKNEKCVCCPENGVSFIDQDIPLNCPYRLEHIIMDKNNVK